MVKNPPANVGDTGYTSSMSGSGRSPRGGHGNPLQCSCLGDPMDRRLVCCSPQSHKESDTTEHAHVHANGSPIGCAEKCG